MDELSGDELTSEWEAIASMVRRAEREGLLVEVVRDFGYYRSRGDSVFDAAFCALCDWDI